MITKINTKKITKTVSIHHSEFETMQEITKIQMFALNHNLPIAATFVLPPGT
jgi:hypothetical protein